MKIICIGRNYSNHAKEMNAPIPEEPLFFLKPDTALFRDSNFYIPEFTNDLHHEVEIVVKIARVGKHIDLSHAPSYYNEIGLGIDFTARDVQSDCKANGLPWEKAKAFDHSAVLGTRFISKDEIKLNDLNFKLFKNDEPVQTGNTRDMLFSIDQLIVHVSKYITLKTGDLLYTGTPEGVGPVTIGDTLKGFIENEQLLALKIK